MGFNQYKNEDLTFSIYIRSETPLTTIAGVFMFRDGNSGVHTSVSSTIVSSPTITSTFKRYEWTLHTKGLVIDTACTCLRVGISLSSSESTEWFILANAQLEEGSNVTPFEQRPVGLELSLCQRYYYESGTINIQNDAYQVMNGYSNMLIALPVSMRITPSVAFTVSGGENLASASILISRSPQLLVYMMQAETTGRFYEYLTNYTANAEL